MPITQQRLISIVRAADTFRGLKQHTLDLYQYYTAEIKAGRVTLHDAWNDLGLHLVSQPTAGEAHQLIEIELVKYKLTRYKNDWARNAKAAKAPGAGHRAPARASAISPPTLSAQQVAQELANDPNDLLNEFEAPDGPPDEALSPGPGRFIPPPRQPWQTDADYRAFIRECKQGIEDLTDTRPPRS